MPTSQNGWPVHTSSTGLAPLAWVTGRVVPGDVHEVFDYLCRRFHAEVEPIIVGHSWGYAYRAIRGQSSGYSNHASATAIDLNAPAHPLGVGGTFSAAQVARIRSILADLDGAVRWGGDYSGRADEMHFEINTDRDGLARVVRKISAPEDDMFSDDDSKRLARIEQMLTEDRKKNAERSARFIKMIDKVRGMVRDDASKRDLDEMAAEIKRDLK